MTVFVSIPGVLHIGRAYSIITPVKNFYIDVLGELGMSVRWKDLFPAHILQRGYDYYRTGKVLSLEEEEGLGEGEYYYAYVAGSEIYHVDITITASRRVLMDCDCPYAEDGGACKHMAATLYMMEEKGLLGEDEAAEEEDEVIVLADSPEGYTYYDIARIAESVVVHDSIVEEAEELIDEGRVKLTGVYERYTYVYDQNYQYSWKRVIDAHGYCMTKRGNQHEISISATRNQVVQAECYFPGCHRTIYKNWISSEKGELCAHLAALLMLLGMYVQRYNPGDATDAAALDFLGKFRAKASAVRRLRTESDETGEKKTAVHLEPRLEIDENGNIAASFKIGKEKGYVVKDITALVDTVEKSGKYALGKKGKIDFASETFAEESAAYYDFIAKEVKGETLRERNYRSISKYDMGLSGESIKTGIPLYGKRLDEFYKLAKEGTVPYVHKRRMNKVTGDAVLQDKPPRVQFEISPVEDTEARSFDGIDLKGDMPKLIEGMDYKYYFEDNALNRAGKDELELLDMLRTDRDSDKIRMRIGRKNLSEFYYRVLPELESFADVQIQNREMIESFLYPEGEFEFFMDVDEDDVTCRANVIYGEFVASLAENSPLQGGSREVFRDVQREKEVESIILEYLPYVDEQAGVYRCDKDEDLIYDLIKGGVNDLMDIGEVQATDSFRNLKIRKKPQISVGVRLERELLDLTVSSEGLSEDELLDLLASYHKKKKYHRLKNGDFIPVDDTALEELSAMFDVLRVSPAEFVKGKMHLPLYRAIYLDRMLEKNNTLYASRDKHFRNLIRNFKTVGDSDYEVPSSLSGIMRNYQEFGYKWLRTIETCGFGGILADDMGLGKTLQIIAVLLAAKVELKEAGQALIVTPASLVYNWREEFAKFAPELNVCVIAGTKAERRDKLRTSGDYDVLVTSYDLLKRDINEYEEMNFGYQVIDEAQYIKNHTTAAAKAVKIINSKVRFALTGTPIENRLSELWSIFDFLMPGFLYSYEQFRKELETPIAKYNDKDAMGRLKRMVEPFVLRRLKGDVLRDLPDKVEETHFVAFEKAQRELYDGQAVRMKKMLMEESDEDFEKNKIKILAEITRIRQICCDPSLCFEDYKGESAKREACIDLIGSAIDGEHKMLVFSQFTSMLELLEEELESRNIGYYKITGATKKEERVDLVRQFNNDDTPVFLISLKAGGTGLNLTGADIVIHYDPWWNIAAQNQATDRAHRIGQEKNVTVYKLIVKGSIEEKILKMQENKKALADEILSGETGGLMTMSREELLELF